MKWTKNVTIKKQGTITELLYLCHSHSVLFCHNFIAINAFNFIHNFKERNTVNIDFTYSLSLFLKQTYKHKLHNTLMLNSSCSQSMSHRKLETEWVPHFLLIKLSKDQIPATCSVSSYSSCNDFRSYITKYLNQFPLFFYFFFPSINTCVSGSWVPCFSENNIATVIDIDEWWPYWLTDEIFGLWLVNQSFTWNSCFINLKTPQTVNVIIMERRGKEDEWRHNTCKSFTIFELTSNRSKNSCL